MKPNNYKTIGITGGIATGKSTVTNIIKKNRLYCNRCR